MRIALIASPWVPVPPPAYGGTEVVVDLLARGFATAGHDVVLFTTGDSTSPVPKRGLMERSEGTRIGQVVPELRHMVTAYDDVAEFDVVHDHTVSGPLYAATLVDGPLVVTTNHRRFDEELYEIYRAIGRATPIIAISHDHARRARDIPISAVIHNGIDVDAFELGPGDGGYLLNLSRMVPEKGVREAARIARRAGVRLKIASKMRSPWEQQYFMEEVEPYLGDGVEYVGEVGPVERLELIRGARALLNPIQWPEPFGLAMVEALACGTPVVAHPLGSVPEIVADGMTGFLRRDEDSLITAIDHIDEIDRVACRASVARRFSADRMVDDHLALFERLLDGRARRRPLVTVPFSLPFVAR